MSKKSVLFFVVLLCFFIELKTSAQPANDNCSNAITITNLSGGCTTYNSTGATADLANGSCTNYSENMWFNFVAQGPDISISVVNGVFKLNPEITIIYFDPTDCDFASAYEVACISDVGVWTSITGILTVGQEYYIIITSIPANAGTFDLCVTNPVPPLNDLVCDAFVLPVDGSCLNGQTNIASSADWYGGCVPSGTTTVWYSVMLTDTNNTLTVDLSTNTFGGDVNMFIATNDNPCPANDTMTLIDDYCGPAGSNIVFSGLIAGTQYYLSVGTASGDNGTFNICGTQSTPGSGCGQNYDCGALSEVINLVSETQTCVPGCNAGSPSTDMLLNGCDDFLNPTVWYEITIPAGDVLLDITVTSTVLTEPHITVFDNTCNSFYNQSCETGSGGTVSLTNYNINSNTTYYIAVEDFVGGEGNFDICVMPYPDLSACNVSDTVILTSSTPPPDVNGNYLPGTTVEFCYSVNRYNQTAMNFLHGVIPTLGSGWDTTTLAPTVTPAPQGINEPCSQWAWFPAGTVLYNNVGANGKYPPNTPMGEGWWFQSTNSPGGPWNCGNISTLDPDNGWGDGCTDTVISGVTAANCNLWGGTWQGGGNCWFGCITDPDFGFGYNWTFCFEATTKNTYSCTSTEDLSVSLETFADGETGSWTDPGCTSDNPYIQYVSAPPVDPIVITVDSLFDVSCFGDTDGEIYVTATGGYGVLQYQLNGGPWQANGIFTSLAPGIYTINIIDDLSCTNSINLTINEPAVLSATVSKTDATCYGTGTGTATVTPSGGTVPYAYLWSIGQTNAVAVNLSAGSYTVTVTDARGCTTTANVIINQPPALTGSIIATDVSCNSGNNGTANLTASGGSPGYTFIWSNSQTSEDISSLSAATYFVTITDINSCTLVLSVNISEPPSLSVSFVTTDVSCNGASTGSATVAVTGGTPLYSYLWNNGDTSDSLNGISAGIYSVTVTDNNGCTIDSSVTINEPSILLLSATSQTNPSCYSFSNGSATVAASGGTAPYSYLWNTGNTSASLSGLSAGIYSVTVTDANLCTSSTEVTITEPAILTVSFTGNDANCNASCDGNITATPSGGTAPYSYQWDDPLFQTAQAINNLCADIYSLTITDNNNCAYDSSYTIGEPPSLIITAGSNDASCGMADGSAWVNVSGGSSPYLYNWSNSETTDTITNISSGAYLVTITDNNGCSKDTVVSVSDLGAPAPSITSSSNVTCNGICDGSATVSAIGGTPPFNYLWSDLYGQTTATADSLCAGIVNVTVTDASNCASSVSVQIFEPTALFASITSSIDVSCNGNSDGSATVSVSGGILPYLFLWSSGGSSATETGLPAGNYNVIITDDNSCTILETVTIFEPAALTIVVTDSSNISCNSDNDGFINLTIAGGTTPYLYSWLSGQTTQDLSNIPAGIYFITVTDDNSCSLSDSVQLIEPDILAASITGTDVSCYGAADGTVTANVSGGTFPYTYIWNMGCTDVACNVSAGIYSVTITDAHLCTTTANQFISEPQPLIADISETNVLCNGASNGIADLSVSGGTAPYSYLWSNSATTEDLTGISAAVYFVTVTDNNNCIVYDSVDIVEPEILSANITGTDILCNGNSTGSIDLTISGGATPYSYLWSNSATTQDLINIQADIYYVSIIDNNTCTTTDSVILSEPPALSSAIANTDVNCFGDNDGFINLSVNGGVSPYSYLWSNSQITEDLINIPAGNYSVTVTANNICTLTANVTVTQPPQLTVTISAQSNVSCNGGNNGMAFVNASGGVSPYGYFWSDGQTLALAANLSAGIYVVTVTDNNLCTVATTATITEPAILNAGITGQTNISCNGLNDGDATAGISGGISPFDYVWSNGTSTMNTGMTTNTVFFLNAGTYNVIVTDNNNCKDTAFVTITEPAVLSANISSQSDVSCYNGNDGTATVTQNGGTPAYTYLWNTGESTDALQGVSVGTYIVTVTDANSCTATVNVTIAQPAALTATITTQINVSCDGGGDGSATATGGGGTAPFSYVWNDPVPAQSTATVTGLTAGTWTVTVTDANLCTSTVAITITEPGVLNAIITSTTNVSCNGGSDGGATALASGGTPLYTYLWNSGDTSASLSGLSAGTYIVTITDANNCTTTATANITQPSALTTTITGTETLCIGASTGSATVTVTGGTQPYTYLWDAAAGNQSTPTASGLEAGTYSVTVTDANSCTATNSFTVTEPSALTTTPSSINSTCGASNGTASVNVTGGTGGYSYDWSPDGYTGDGTNTYSALPSGSYTVTVTDGNGCTISQNITVNNTNGPAASILSQTNVSCNGGADGQATATQSGGTGPYNYIWNNPAPAQSAATVTGLTAGTWTVTVTDSNLCTETANVTITEPTAVTASLSSLTSVSCNSGGDGSVTVTAGGGTPGYTYLWNDPPPQQTNDTATNLSAGIYTVTVTDINGCTITDSIIISEPSQFTVIITSADVSCFGGSDGSASLFTTGGTPPYTYLWNDVEQSTTETVNNLAAIGYTCTITDFNACTVTAMITIEEPAKLLIQIAVTDVLCFGYATGSATVLVTGGTPSYSYNWSSGGNSTVETGLSAGSYTITVTDINSCSVVDTFIITQPPSALVIHISHTDASCYQGNDGTATIYDVEGGTLPYQYAWSDYQTTQTAVNLQDEIYTVTVTDNNGCKAIQIVDINAAEQILVTPAITATSCMGNDDGVITLSVSGGILPYYYHWSNDSSRYTVNGLRAETYFVTITDANNCSLTNSYQVTDSPNDCLEIPDVFTPNGDGYNDTWDIKNIDVYQDVSIEIYNRWGILVFECEHGYSEPWDGRYKNKKESLPFGPYTYIIDLQNGSDKITGVVTIVK
ncbi:MAG: gliding motility-associated C-terminal domain-containing protein [Bacteroidia bacterium]|nr:gliding motility-associated C-terminal domain-containing protein [Bacteroidia bacterium]